VAEGTSFLKELIMTRSNRWRRAAGRAALAALVLTLALGPEAARAARKTDSIIKVTAKSSGPDRTGKETVYVTLAIEKGWHAYANPVLNKDLESVQTVLTVTAKKKPASVKISYPKGKQIMDKDAGNYWVYEGKAVIKAVVRRAKGDTGPLQVSVKMQACNDKACLPPATVKLTLK
jgi:DsbC/DsbD-like thiol-disulfide interchange protein